MKFLILALFITATFASMCKNNELSKKLTESSMKVDILNGKKIFHKHSPGETSLAKTTSLEVETNIFLNIVVLAGISVLPPLFLTESKSPEKETVMTISYQPNISSIVLMLALVKEVTSLPFIKLFKKTTFPGLMKLVRVISLVLLIQQMVSAQLLWTI